MKRNFIILIFIILAIGMVACDSVDHFEENRDGIENIIKFQLSVISYAEDLEGKRFDADMGLIKKAGLPSVKLVNEVVKSLGSAPDIKDAFRSLYSKNPQRRKIVEDIYIHYRDMKVQLKEPDLQLDNEEHLVYKVTELGTQYIFLVTFHKDASGTITHFEVGTEFEKEIEYKMDPWLENLLEAGLEIGLEFGLQVLENYLQE